jgi:hypothetical protein
MPKLAIFLVALLIIVSGFIGYVVFAPSDERSRASAPTDTASLQIVTGDGAGTVGSGTEPGTTTTTPLLGGIEPATGSIPSVGGAKFDASPSKSDYEKGEVLVVDPPPTFIEFSRQSGFSVIDKTQFSELAMTLYLLRIPTGSTVPAARALLVKRFPGIVIDANHLYRTKGRTDYSRHVARRKAGWRKTNTVCGAGVRIGMVDAAVALHQNHRPGRPWARQRLRVGLRQTTAQVRKMIVVQASSYESCYWENDVGGRLAY